MFTKSVSAIKWNDAQGQKKMANKQSIRASKTHLKKSWEQGMAQDTVTFL